MVKYQRHNISDLVGHNYSIILEGSLIEVVGRIENISRDDSNRLNLNYNDNTNRMYYCHQGLISFGNSFMQMYLPKRFIKDKSSKSNNLDLKKTLRTAKKLKRNKKNATFRGMFLYGFNNQNGILGHDIELLTGELSLCASFLSGGELELILEENQQ